MAEILFILVTLYAVYVVHNVVTGNQTSKEDSNVQSPEALKKVVIATKEDVKVELKVKPQKAVAKKVVATKTKVKSKAVAKPKAATKPKIASKSKVASKTKSKSDLPSGSVRNPETGEVVKVASSYRMTKRWIKDALVTEGLLDKVYKVSEIDEAATIKINQALDKFKVMDKFL